MSEFKNVTELNDYSQQLLKSDPNLKNLTVVGEIADFKRYGSGHCYFSLKDDRSKISCVMFSSYYSYLSFQPKSGDKVKVSGSVDLYSQNGSYQLKITGMTPVGTGDLNEMFKRLYEKLNNQGLFAYEHKLPIPVLPRRIGVVTSPSGAVIHDILDTLNRRNPHYDILLYPCAVQGENCSAEVTNGINYFAANRNVDVIIVARGGGSLEDLFGFNSEDLAYAIYNCPIPVISAIGHEVDYTICDYVSDLRAPTPTAAAELVLGKYDDLYNHIANNRLALDIAIARYINSCRERVLRLKNHRALYSPMYYIQGQRDKLEFLKQRMVTSAYQLIGNQRHRIAIDCKSLTDCEISILNNRKNKLDLLKNSLESLGPNQVLNRGYSYITLDSSSGQTVNSVKSLSEGTKVNINFADGHAGATINNISEE